MTLDIDADEFLRVYQGNARDVVARADDGRSLRFPAAILRPFVTRDGISGRFRIQFDGDGRFVDIQTLSG
ncbi:MAG: DUF2835 domain-containing protein [Gammaproteobacteria bacterium]